MLMPKRDLLFRYLGDSKNLAKASGRAERALGGVDQKSRKANKGLSLMRGGAAKLGLVLGGAALAGAAKVSIARAEEMSSKYAITAQIIKQTGGAANLTADQIKSLASEMSIATGVDKSLILAGQNVLLTFKNIRNEVGESNDIFTRASKVMIDFASVMETDAKSGAIQLGKALNDPIKGVSALARVGVTFTDQQKDQIRVMQESGDILSAQNIILAELESQVGGTAEASADATAKISNAWKEVEEQIGNVLLPAIEAIVPAMQAMAREAPAATRKIGIGFQRIQRQVAGVTDAIDLLTGPVFNLGDAWKDGSETLFQVNKRMGQYVESAAAGKDESLLFVSVLADLVKNGDDYFGSVKALAEATGISGDKFKEAALFAIRYKDDLGLTEEQVSNFKRELQKMEMGTSDLFAQMKETEGGLGDFGEELDDEADKADDAARSVADLADEMKSLIDPVFAAERATDKFNETLAKVQEDAVVTQDELEDLTSALADMQAATEAVTPENLVAYSEKSREALGLLDESTIVTRGKLSTLSQTGSADLRAMLRSASELTSKPLIVEIRATGPTRAEMDRLVRGSLSRLAARGIRIT